MVEQEQLTLIVAQAAGYQGRHRVHRTVQRVRHLHRSCWVTADLRPARSLRDHRVRRALLVDSAAAADRARPCRRLLVGAVDAPGGDLTHLGVRRARHARGFFEALVADNLDIGRPELIELIFRRGQRRGRPAAGQFNTKVVTYGTEVNVNAFYRHSRIKQYLKDGRALRIETVINDPGDLGCLRRLAHLDELQARARAVNTALLDTERVDQGCVLASPAVERIARPTLTEDGRRAPA